MDETGWRTAGQRRALWGMFTSRHAFFRLAPGRHEDHAKRLLTGHTGIVTSDRWWAYNHLPLTRRQLCWSHLRRDFTAHAEGLAAERDFGEAGLVLCERVFWAWEVFQHTGDRRELQHTIRRLQHTYKPIIRGYATKRARNRHCRGIARNLLKAWPALWTFAANDGVEPTNNHAERSLRGAVIYRKLSLGSQSEAGERRIERLLSASITCRPQHRSLFVYLTELLATHARDDPTPSLTQKPEDRTVTHSMCGVRIGFDPRRTRDLEPALGLGHRAAARGPKAQQSPAIPCNLGMSTVL
jgi:transposase